VNPPGTLVSRWFGPRFAALDPRLRQLHLEGGRLLGEVELEFGPGPAGALGRRLARKMGLPATPGRLPLEVDISHSERALVWSRRFGGTARPMVSLFEPVGCWPEGFWRERTGAMDLRLTVDVRDGGWHWRVLGARLHGLPVPVRLLPRSHAGKWIVDGAYRFEVAFVAPLLGTLLRYGGTLQLHGPPLNLNRDAAWPAGSPPPGSGAGGTAA
jgi:hypothetical protein